MICIMTSHCVQNEVALGRTRSKWTAERPSARGDDGLDWDGTGGGDNLWIQALHYCNTICHVVTITDASILSTTLYWY